MPEKKRSKIKNRPPEGAFDFGALINSAFEDYLSRPVIEREVVDHIEHNKSGCCVIVGEPGSGKTSLAAFLIRSHGYIHHFLRSGHTEFSLWSDPHSFLTSIGFNLRGIYGDAIFPKAVTLDVNGRVRDVAEQGTFAGAEIMQLVTVPWHSATMNVRLDAERIQGKAAGVRIHQVVEDYRRLPLPAYREMALIDPLRRLRQLHPEDSVVLWVDGLDEEFELRLSRNDSDGSKSIADILPLPDELAELGNLALVISSRPSQPIKRFLERGAFKIDLGDPKFAQDNAAVVERYIDRELAQANVTAQIEEAGKSAAEIRKAIIEVSGHNLLYLRHFFIGLRSGDLQDLLTGGLPDSLDSIYTRLLGRIVRGTDGQYLSDYHPIISSLAVAMRSLTAEQISWFSEIDQNHVNVTLDKLRPFLDADRIDSRNVYAFYHRSFRDSLTSPSHRDEVWNVTPQNAHGRIAQYYLQKGKSAWDELDDYGFDFLTHHLAHGDSSQRQSLFALLDEPWRKAKRKHYRSNLSFAKDLSIASDCALSLPFTSGLIETGALAIKDTLVAEVAGKVAPGALELLVRMGQAQRALDYVRPNLHPVITVRLLAGLIRGFSVVTDRTLMYTVMERGLEYITAYPEQAHGLLETLLEACPLVSDDRMLQLINRAVEIFNTARSYWATPGALAEIARLMTAGDDDSATETFHNALTAINQYSQSSQGLKLVRLFGYWVEYDLRSAVDAFAEQPLGTDVYSIEALLIVSRAAARAGYQENLTYAHTQIEQKFLPHIKNPYERARAVTMMAALEVEIGQPSQAEDSIMQALASIKAIGSAEDPDRHLQNRMADATRALTLAAEADLKINPSRGQVTLQQAWASLQQHGCNEEEDIELLVSMQFHVNPDLLDIWIARILEDPELRQALLTMPFIEGEPRLLLLTATSAELLSDDPQDAEKRLEEALMFLEVPQSRFAGHAEFCLKIAQALALINRVDAQELLDQSYRSGDLMLAGWDDELVSWRLNVLRDLIERNDSNVASWLSETTEKWATSSSPIDVILNLPSMVKDLPDDLVLQMAQQVDQVVSGTHKMLLAGAVSARLKSMGLPPDEMLKSVLSSLDSDDNEAVSIHPHRILAFIAGQWWNLDRPLAERLWLEALLRLEADPNLTTRPESRGLSLIDSISDLLIGAPEAAIPVLLAYEEPPPVPNKILQFTVGSPGAPPHLGAGITKRDYLLAQALAREAMKPGVARERLATVTNPAVRGLATSTAARIAHNATPEERLSWCQASEQAAGEFEKHYLQCLFKADAAEAFYSIGAKRKAVELAYATARDIIEHGEYFGALYRESAYPHALGKCLKVVVRGRDTKTAMTLLWEARRLGIGFHIALGYVVPVVAETGDNALRLFQEAELHAIRLFS